MSIKGKMIMDVFIATKPLQYINCINISNNSCNSICCICDQFADSYHFFELCVNEGKFNNYLFFKTKEKALFYWLCHQHQIDSLYLDSDFGLYTRFILFLFLHIKVFVYEEGYASYQSLRGDSTLKDRLLLKMQNFFRIKNYNGGSKKVKGVYLYNKEKYDKAFPEHNKCILSFKSPFFDVVEQSQVLSSLSDQVDWELFKGKRVLIYLSSWSISNTAIDYCRDRDDVDIKVLKLHPNIKDYPEALSDCFNYVLPSCMIFEFFYAKVRKVVKKIVIVHHRSFAVEYIDEKDKAISVII